MPAKNRAQQRALYAKKGEAWVKEHHFDRINPNLAMGEVGYRPADDTDFSCATCGYFVPATNGCTEWRTLVGHNMTCDSWKK